MTAFDNCVPLDVALLVVDAEKHPLTYSFVRKSVESVPFIWPDKQEHRREKWLDGYRRFGDQFERVFEQYHVTVNRPADVTDALERHLFDPWMVVGLLEPELPVAVQRINRALMKSFDRASREVTEMYLEDVEWPSHLDGLVAWLPDDHALRYALSTDRETDWEARFRVCLDGTSDNGWSAAQALSIIGDVPYEEAVRMYRLPVLRTPENMLMHYRDDIPLELLP